MSQRPPHRRALPILLTALLWVVTAGCVALSGEPPIVSTRPATTAQPTPSLPPAAASDLGYPATPPDLANGASLYAQHCAACHGDSGRGDGPVALNAGMSPGNFTDPASARAQTPHEWFSTITYGRIENLMPPWQNVLTEQERWDVALYTYTLHVTPQERQLGAMLYQECADCHGNLGRGDGPEAPNVQARVKDLTNQQAMVTLSDQSIYRMVEQGFEDVMPAYADRFTDSDIWAVVAYTRGLSLQLTTADADDGQTIDVSGTVTLYGQDRLPDGLTAELIAFDAASGQPVALGAASTPISADGTYRFEDAPRRPGLLYFTSVSYQGYPFASAPRPPETAPTLTLDVTLYNVTSDPTGAVMAGWVTQITAYDGLLDIASVMQVRNPSDRLMYSSGSFLPDGRPIAFTVEVPDGASLLPPDPQTGLLVAEDGRSLIDVQPLPPRGQRLLPLRYTLPYQDGQTIELPTPISIGGTVRVLLRPLEMRLDAPNLPALGEEALGGESYKAYGAQLALPAGEPLRFRLQGQPLPQQAAPTPSPTSTAPPAGQSPTPDSGLSGEALAPVLALAGLLIAAGSLYLMLARKKPQV